MADSRIRRRVGIGNATGNGSNRHAQTASSWMKYFTKSDTCGSCACAAAIVCLLLVCLYLGAVSTCITKWLGEQVNVLKSPAVILLATTIIVPCIVFGVGMSSDVFWNRRFLAFTLVVSFIWNWIYLYQKENNHAQLNLQIPANCMPHKMTLQEWLTSMMSIRTDECFEYHGIPLTRALSRTISLFFVDTFNYIVQAFYECHAEIFRDQPILVALSALVVCYGFGFVTVYFVYVNAQRTTSTVSYP